MRCRWERDLVRGCVPNEQCNAAPDQRVRITIQRVSGPEQPVYEEKLERSHTAARAGDMGRGLTITGGKDHGRKPVTLRVAGRGQAACGERRGSMRETRLRALWAV